MSSGSRQSDRQRLEREIAGAGYAALLGRLREKEPFLQRFASWAEVLEFMHRGTSRDPRKDLVLRPILQAHGEDRDPHWRTLLLAFFWPGLESIHSRRRRWDADPDERWQGIVWAFLRVVCRVDVRTRPDRLVQKLFNGTVRQFHKDCSREWARADVEVPTDPDHLDAVAVAAPQPRLEAEDERRAEVERLRRHLKAGRISETDFLLLVGTRIYGQSLADYARAEGLDYQAAKKRRQRAEAAIRPYEENPRKSPDSCPRPGRPQGLLPMEAHGRKRGRGPLP